jgi:hypothetical protein
VSKVDGGDAAEGPGVEPAVDPHSLAGRIIRLRTKTAEDPEHPPSWESIAWDANVKAGARAISGQYAWLLGTGRKDNPTRDHIDALAAKFGVDPAYLVNRSTEAVRAAALAVGGDGQESKLKALLEFIAEYFGVDRDYFLDSEVQRQVDEELAYLSACGSGQVRSLLTRTVDLSPAGWEKLGRHVAQLRIDEGLDPAEG